MTSTDVMVLCAGLGTRLRPLTLERPKPSVPLLNRPLVSAIFRPVRTLGARRVIVNTHYLPDVMAAVAREEAQQAGLELAISRETVLLGTGGGPWFARARNLLQAGRHLMVLNGDVLSDADLRALMTRHLETGAAATMVLRDMPPGAGYTPIEVDESGRIRRIGSHGRPTGGAPHLFTGAHVLSPDALDLLPSGESSIITAVYAPLLQRGAVIQSVKDARVWLDLGDPRGYLEAHLALLRGQVPADSLPRLGLAEARPVSPDAVVATSATLEETTIGARAQGGVGAGVGRCHGWADSLVPARSKLHRCVVTPRGVYQVEG
jgi:mannose-1-phosphate guanylyltransferase